MRSRTTIALVFCGLLMLVVFWVVEKKRDNLFIPRATLTVLEYSRTNVTSYTGAEPKEDQIDSGTPSLRFSTSPLDPGLNVQTNAGVLLVRVRLKNTGTQPIAFESWDGHVPYYGCRVERQSTWEECSGIRLSGAPGMLDIAKAVDLTIWLPSDVTAWEFALSCHKPGPRLRTAMRWYDRGWRGWFPEVALHALPHGSPVNAMLTSDKLIVLPMQAAPQTSELHVGK